jgi:hypothetical protein
LKQKKPKRNNKIFHEQPGGALYPISGSGRLSKKQYFIKYQKSSLQNIECAGTDLFAKIILEEDKG